MSDIADRYRRLASDFTDTVSAVPPDAWDRPAPCEGWTAADVANHVIDTQHDFLAAHELAPNELPGELGARWATVREAMQAVLDDPERAGTTYDSMFGPTTIEATVDRFYAFDLVIHRWDLARAAGLADHETIDPTEIERVQADLAALGDNVRLPGVFGPAIEVDADAQTRLLAFAGRQP